jgi:hypothetical protein
MKVRIVAPLYYFKENTGENIGSYPFLLTNDPVIKQEYILDFQHFTEQFGGVNANIVEQNYIYYFGGETNDSDVFKDCNTVTEVGSRALDILREDTTALWFIKDNSAFIREVFIEDVDKLRGVTAYNKLTASTANSELAVTDFTEAELLHSIEVLKKLYDSINKASSHKQHTKELDEEKQKPYDISRITRAELFLNILRSERSLIVKITYYVAIFECLLTSQGTEITHQVSERAALFIGGTAIRKKEIYDIVKNGYGIRSSYIHGSKITKTITELKKVSIELDNLTRELFLKVLEDDHIFTLIETKSKEKEFNDFFKDLLFKDDELVSTDIQAIHK